jgi:hypothetical protein
MDKQFFITMAEAMINGENSLERLVCEKEFKLLSDLKIKNGNELPFEVFAFKNTKYLKFRKDLGEIMLKYAKGIEPFPKLKHLPFTDGSIAVTLALVDVVGSAQTVVDKYFIEFTISRQLIQNWEKKLDNFKERNWEVIATLRNTFIERFKTDDLRDMKFFCVQDRALFIPATNIQMSKFKDSSFKRIKIEWIPESGRKTTYEI